MLRLLNGRRCIGICFRAFRRTNSDKWMSNRCQSNEYISRFIWENTELTGGQSLTPEIKLRLFTPNCRFWDERPELWPFDDPYWAIYWPGGQALSRYLLDNPSVCRGKSVLDLGSGCGASSIAAKKCGAAHVTANDIDRAPVWEFSQLVPDTPSIYTFEAEIQQELINIVQNIAAIATVINCELNAVEPPFCVTDNMISSEPQCFDVILLGDMFYDEALATSLHSWLDLCIKRHGTTVLIGDPGRAQFEEHSIRQLLHQLDQFELPKSVQDENYGLTCSTVWHYQPDL